MQEGSHPAEAGRAGGAAGRDGGGIPEAHTSRISNSGGSRMWRFTAH
jgi:hypothetical protein